MAASCLEVHSSTEGNILIPDVFIDVMKLVVWSGANCESQQPPRERTYGPFMDRIALGPLAR